MGLIFDQRGHHACHGINPTVHAGEFKVIEGKDYR